MTRSSEKLPFEKVPFFPEKYDFDQGKGWSCGVERVNLSSAAGTCFFQKTSRCLLDGDCLLLVSRPAVVERFVENFSLDELGFFRMRFVPWCGLLPKVDVLEDPADDIFLSLGDEADDLHFLATFWACKRIRLPHLFDAFLPGL
jgi:hypothetical protein